ncbi:hypothetical protein [Bacillus methanolicus]|uniref:Uncharacterized protein n=1 Tax=Bacillus methanolicus (strain MGA3 / ATCC 53907) TaxID=796606 RepID=I3DTI8_BACMM|nr:hypothetical protein [Bacillus methanolicus]AIE61715.1 hypothetical protein BMMGA3_16830 [Bacillus methanolicus MGA3]EIJ77559.1 hypothetical protein MGA3_17717 [Bacillus methanolicus MGA3]
MFIRAYYDKLTGNGLKWYSLEGGAYRIPTFEEDYQAIKELSERITNSNNEWRNVKWYSLKTAVL